MRLFISFLSEYLHSTGNNDPNNLILGGNVTHLLHYLFLYEGGEAGRPWE